MKVHEAFKDEFKVYFVFDQLNGKTLFDRIMEEGCLLEKDVAVLSAFMISTVKYLHKQGIVLRNLRPESFLFENDD